MIVSPLASKISSFKKHQIMKNFLPLNRRSCIKSMLGAAGLSLAGYPALASLLPTTQGKFSPQWHIPQAKEMIEVLRAEYSGSKIYTETSWPWRYEQLVHALWPAMALWATDAQKDVTLATYRQISTLPGLLQFESDFKASAEALAVGSYVLSLPGFRRDDERFMESTLIQHEFVRMRLTSVFNSH